LKVRKSELHYLWKCALLEKRSYEVFERICSSQEVGHWKIRCLLEGLRSDSHISEALNTWLRRGNMVSKDLTILNGQLKSSEKEVIIPYL